MPGIGSRNNSVTAAARLMIIKSVVLFIVAGCYILSILPRTQASTGEISAPPLQF